MKWIKTAIGAVIMKKAKIGIFCVLLMVLSGLGLAFVPVRVMGLDWSDAWAMPESAKSFVDSDGRGIRVYINKVYDYVSDGEFTGELHFATLAPFKEYHFDGGGSIGTGGIVDHTIGRNFFDSDLLDMIQEAGWDEAVSISEEDRIYVYFDVDRQVFTFEGRGLDYLEYWMSKYFDLVGNDDGGYEEGYQDGFIDGEKSKLAKNNEAFYNNIAIWIPAVITLVALASIISIFGIKKKE